MLALRCYPWVRSGHRTLMPGQGWIGPEFGSFRKNHDRTTQAWRVHSIYQSRGFVQEPLDKLTVVRGNMGLKAVQSVWAAPLTSIIDPPGISYKNNRPMKGQMLTQAMALFPSSETIILCTYVCLNY